MVRRAGKKILQETLWWSFPGAAKKKQNKAASGKKNWNVRNEIHWHPD
jgi:hypothetical protein